MNCFHYFVSPPFEVVWIFIQVLLIIQQFECFVNFSLDSRDRLPRRLSGRDSDPSVGALYPLFTCLPAGKSPPGFCFRKIGGERERVIARRRDCKSAEGYRPP